MHLPPKKNPQMMSGYAFEAPGDWHKCPNDDWDIVVYTPKGDEAHIGNKVIDGSLCRVFSCPDGKFRAQTAVSTG